MTDVYGSQRATYSNESIDPRGYTRSKLTYSVANTSNTVCTVTVKTTVQYYPRICSGETEAYAAGGLRTEVLRNGSIVANVTGDTRVLTDDTWGAIPSSKANKWYDIASSANYSFTVDRSHSDQTITLQHRVVDANSGITSHWYYWTSENVSITIPKKPSYNVAFDANGGSGAPSAQTKWYGETLTLSSTKPTRENCTFQKWNTVKGGTGTNYNPGGSYTANAAATLYAQWKYNHTAPTITSFVVKRCDSDGTDNEEGESCKVEAAYEIDTKVVSTAKIASYTVKVGSNAAVTTTVSGGTSSGTISYVYNSSTVSVANPYNVTLTVTDNVTDVVSGTVGYSSSRTSVLSRSFFTMDFLSGGHGVGIGKAATEDNLLDIAMETRFNALATAQGTTSSSVAYGSTNPRFRFSNANASQNGELAFTDYDAIHTGATLAWITDQPQSWFHTQHIKMTGNADVDGTVAKRWAAMNYSTAPSSTIYAQPTTVYDNAGNVIGHDEYAQTTAKSIQHNFAAVRQYNGSAWAWYQCSMTVSSSGAVTYSIHTPAAFRNAIGASSGTWPVSIGGTGKTSGTFYGATSIKSSGTTGTITLSQTAANFSLMLIVYSTNDSEMHSVWVHSPNNKYVSLCSFCRSASSIMMFKAKRMQISGTSITEKVISSGATAAEAQVTSSNSCNVITNANAITVQAVYGWK